jgi:hypothetical protein
MVTCWRVRSVRTCSRVRSKENTLCKDQPGSDLSAFPTSPCHPADQPEAVSPAMQRSARVEPPPRRPHVKASAANGDSPAQLRELLQGVSRDAAR